MIFLLPADGLRRLVYIACLVLVPVSGDMDWLYRLGPTEYVFTCGQRKFSFRNVFKYKNGQWILSKK
jgi:hypothetical protein